MRRNPKYALGENLDEEMLAHAFAHPKMRWDLSLDWEKGRQVVAWGGRGKTLAEIDVPNERIILVRGDIIEPTTIHWLYELLLKLPKLRSMKIVNHLGTWGGGNVEVEDSGYTGEEFMQAVREVSEESVVRHGRDEERDETKTFRYRALATAQEMDWFHATLAKNVESIMRHGLRPSKSEGAEEGWSPGWNMGIQRGVYLTNSEGYARQIAETVATRNELPAVLLRVDGRGLEDTKLLTFDEDVLRDEFHDSPDWEAFDGDFPQWVTGFEAKISSVAYLGPIALSAISEVARCAVKIEAYATPYSQSDATPETDPDSFEFVAETSWSDGWAEEK